MSESEKNEVPMSEPTSTPSTPSAAEKPKKIRDKVVKFMCAVLLALIFLLAGLIGGWLIGVNSLDDRARSLVWLLERVEANYYREIDDEELYDRLYAALELDKFCTYYNEDEYDSLIRESQGNNSGLGISVIYEGDAVRLYRTVYNSPAERAGLEGGMYLYRYGQDAEHLAEVNSGTFMNGVAALSTVTLEAGFEGGERKLYTVTRESYSAAYCEYRDSESSFRFRGKGETVLAETEQGGMSSLDATTAYIRFTEFDGNAAREFRLCLEKMKERGRTNLVLDLRCNGGGYLVTLCQIAAHLLKNAEGRSPLVATARYRNGRVDRYTAAGNDFGEYFTDTSRIRVLADENSASASSRRPVSSPKNLIHSRRPSGSDS